MAANPVRPTPDAALYQITIAPGGTVTSNQNLKITNQDSIAFHNNAGFPVNIRFTSVFNPINNLQQNTSAAPNGGPALNTTINYVIVNANTGVQTGGPYCVQFGVGPLTINIANLETSPDPISIPPGGEIVFVCDATYSIAWTSNKLPVTAWTPQPLKLYANAVPNPNPVQTALPAVYGQTVTYTIANSVETRGGGTVVIGA